MNGDPGVRGEQAIEQVSAVHVPVLSAQRPTVLWPPKCRGMNGLRLASGLVGCTRNPSGTAYTPILTPATSPASTAKRRRCLIRVASMPLAVLLSPYSRAPLPRARLADSRFFPNRGSQGPLGRWADPRQSGADAPSGFAPAAGCGCWPPAVAVAAGDSARYFRVTCVWSS